MTLDEELALIQQKAAPAANPAAVQVAPAPEAAAPAATPPMADAAPDDVVIPDPTPFKADPEDTAEPNPGDDMPAFQTDLPILSNDEPASVWENMNAGWTEDTITRNRRDYHQGKRRDLALDMFSRLPDDARQRVMDRRWDYENNWIDLEQMVIDEVAKDIARDPARYGDMPLTQSDFDARITAEEKAELAEAQATLERPGGLISEFIGSAGSTMYSPTQGAMMFAGAGAGGLLRVLATEAVIGGASEAVDLPDQFDAARRLDQPEPDALSQIALGAGLSAGLVGAIKTAARLPSAARSMQERATIRRQIAIQSAPEGMAPHEAVLAVDAAEGALRGERTVQEAIAPQPEAGTLGDVLAGGPGFTRVLEAGKGYTVVAGPNGQALRREGTRAWRNNNPGNIEYGNFARSQGAVGTDGRFAVFPTYEAGRAAKAQLLWGSKGYRGMTIGQAINRYAPPFENNTAGYASTVARAAGAATNTPMSSLTAAQRKLMLDAMERVEGFRPGKENGVAAPAQRAGILPPTTGADVPSFRTSRGYTETGQVTAGDGFKIDVDYQVVDLSTLFRATGDFQPRDRSRINSDAWIADTAARLDPAQLMPSPTADRGTPIVGPDGMIESGNGRYGAIERAYERHPDRADAYRGQIEAAGYAIPEGVTRPVLVARRKTELSNEQLQRFTLEAQDSGVAAMTPTEVARASSRAMSAPVLGQLDPSAPLTDAANGGFVRAALAGLPRSARNAMFDASGKLNREGNRQLREALFARAWPDADILARFTETDPGEMKSLMEALETSAPAWAALRADIEAGAVVPDMDISGHILDAMRLIAQARDMAKKGGPKTDSALAELLDEVDLLTGPVPPLTVAMVRKFWTNSRAAKADDVAGFLTRYANDARKAGASGGMFDSPSPRDVLQAIDGAGFADVPADIGAARGYRAAEPTEGQALPEEGFDQGALSPEAVAADAAIRAELEAPISAHDAETPDMPAPDRFADLRDGFEDLSIDMPDGTALTIREVLNDLDADDGFDAFLQACAISPIGANQ